MKTHRTPKPEKTTIEINIVAKRSTFTAMFHGQIDSGVKKTELRKLLVDLITLVDTGVPPPGLPFDFLLKETKK